MAAEGEFELIYKHFAAATCARPAPFMALGIGDDCALLNPPRGAQLAISTDTQVAGVHFPHNPDPFLLAQRSLAAAASDLAAMGATPLAFTLALTLPSTESAWLARFAHGLDVMAQRCNLRLIGGDTTRGPLNINFTVFGHVPTGQALTRAGATIGDWLCIGGTTGEAAAALPLVLGERAPQSPDDETLLARYWTPQPQLALGQQLRGLASAALDVSDGLLADCAHIAAASGVKLQLHAPRIPLTKALQHSAGQHALTHALSGGDDYVLAFTLPPSAVPALRASGHPFWMIGQVVAGQGVQLLDANGHDITPAMRGYQHFGASDEQT